MDMKELEERQAWPLKQKIDHALFTIETFLSRTEGKAYVAFSGGKDSTVLLDLVRIIDPQVPAVFVNTGNEYPEIVRFVRHLRDDLGYNIQEVHPRLKPRQVWERYGFPLISKEQANLIHKVRTNPDTKIARKAMSRDTRFRISDKWRFLTAVEYETSEMCCQVLKKNPSHDYERATGRAPILGVMASESIMRAEMYVRRGGCSSFKEEGATKTMSAPLSIWTDADIWAYIEERGLEVAEIYRQGVERTGCVGCGFGCQFGGRFDTLYRLYPKYYEMIMNYTNNGVKYRDAVRQVLAVNGHELPDESGAIMFDYE